MVLRYPAVSIYYFSLLVPVYVIASDVARLALVWPIRKELWFDWHQLQKFPFQEPIPSNSSFGRVSLPEIPNPNALHFAKV